MTKIINISNITSKFALPDASVKEYSVNSNTSSTENMTLSFDKNRTTAKDYIGTTEEVEQTLELTNNSELNIDNIRISDNISEAGEFVTGSMTIDGQPFENFDASNYTLPNSLAPGDKSTIKYNVRVKDDSQFDIINILSNITYDVAEVKNLVEKSNTISLQIYNNVLLIEKTVNKTVAISKQTLTFTNVITNKGNLKNTEILFKDPIPEGTKFVTGSVKIDNVVQEDADPVVGISLSDLDVGSSITVSFDVTVD